MKTIIKLLIVASTLAACASRDKDGKILDTPTSGEITIAVDESLKPLIEAEVKAFEGLYHDAHIKVMYTSEEDAFKTLLKDSARLAIVTRKMVPAEEKVLAELKIVPQQLMIAKDGVALIVNRQNADTTISLTELKKILEGKQHEATKPRRKAGHQQYQVVFDQPHSGIIRFLKDSVASFESLPDYCFAVNGNKAVVDHVSANPNTLGLIDVSWISDADDSTANKFLQSIRVMAVAADSDFYQPYQAFIAQRQYPLLRDVMMISREARSGLASGFMAFVASDKGQRIVLTSGLVPATMPIRIVEVNHEPL
jgi:phosphate transport system substrate-binding protein